MNWKYKGRHTQFSNIQCVETSKGDISLHFNGDTDDEKEMVDIAKKFALLEEMYEALLYAQPQLGDIVRDGHATDDDIEAYERIKEVLDQIHG